MTPAELDELEKRARAATPTPRVVPGQLSNGSYGVEVRSTTRAQAGHDAAYIVSTPPEVTLALVAEVRRLRRLESAMRYLSSGPWLLKNLNTGSELLDIDSAKLINLATREGWEDT